MLKNSALHKIVDNVVTILIAFRRYAKIKLCQFLDA